MSEEVFEQARSADAIVFGAMGLPDVRCADGTEIAPQLDLRFRLGLYAGIRPVKALPGGARPLGDPRGADVDLVIVRESTEGLFASRGKGIVEDDRIARDTMVITRETCERLFDASFRLAGRRKARGGKGKVTCVDKSNVFASMAFFRKVFDERAVRFPDIEPAHHYVDAAALDLVRKPWEFDVMVTENMFGDILSDLAAALAGGMGMAPSADVGDGSRAVPARPRERAGHRRAGDREPHRHDPVRGDDARLAGRASRRTGLRRGRPAHRRRGGRGARRRAGPPGGPRRRRRDGSRHPRDRRRPRRAATAGAVASWRFRVAEPRMHRPEPAAWVARSRRLKPDRRGDTP